MGAPAEAVFGISCSMQRVSESDSIFGGGSVNRQFASNSGGSDNGDYQLPMLEHTTALSDG